MSVAEMKKDIFEKVEDLTEEQLLQLQKYLGSIKTNKSQEYHLLEHVESIVSERAEVLKKLSK